MLHFIRERAQGWVAWFIVGLITIPFALWGVNSYVSGPTDIVVASVNGEKIKQAEFQQALQQYRDRMRQSMGESFDPSLFDNANTKQQILDGLIEQKLLLAASQTLGLNVSDQEISQRIRNTPAFHVEGQFDSQRYKAQLNRAGFSPARYEAQLRTDILTQQLTDAIQQTALVTDSSVSNLLRLEKQQRDIAYGTVEAAPLAADITINDDEVVLYYQDNKARYTSPERLSIDYVELTVDELAQTIEFDDEKLQQFYTDNQQQFMSPEQRQASHILLEGDDEQALATIATIKQRLLEGASFEDLAKEYSADSGSAVEGGNLGFFERDVMDPEFEKAVFSMTEIGEVSDAVKTEFGYHIIKLTAILEPKGKAFSEAKDEIAMLFRRQEAEQLFFEKAEQLADISYENPDNLDVVAEELALTIKSSEMFTREGGEGITDNHNVINAAFSDEVLLEDLNSPVIELTKSHSLVLHKKQYVEESQLPFEVVSAAITESLKLQKARNKASEKGNELIAQLKAGVTAETLFTDGNWQPRQIISRSDAKLNAELLEHAYTIAKPVGEPVYSGFTASNGNYIIIKLNDVIDGNVAEASQQDRDGLSAYLSRYSGDNELRAFIASLKDSADIDISTHYIK